MMYGDQWPQLDWGRYLKGWEDNINNGRYATKEEAYADHYRCGLSWPPEGVERRVNELWAALTVSEDEDE